MSSDTRIVKIWDALSGDNFTNIEPAEGGDINDVCLWPDSGLIMVASDAPKVLSTHTQHSQSSPLYYLHISRSLRR